MFQPGRRPQNAFSSALQIAELIYHSMVRDVRRGHNNAFIALGINLLQILVFVAIFYVMFSLLGLRGSAIRGDFLLYVMSGIFLYMTHVKTVAIVGGSEGPTSAMMKHAPMNTIISTLAAGFGSLYMQTLSLIIILYGYHIIVKPVEIDRPIAAYGMLLVAWFTGFAVGLIVKTLKPWFPTATGVFSNVYQRANMIASGKMFVANSLPGFMLAMFDWNPLFHCIDQARGFTFINYNPHYSSISYPIYVGSTLMILGMMGEFYTRRRISTSWEARR
ncbi:MAG: ABC transporter permease [Sulfitobacter sp.]